MGRIVVVVLAVVAVAAGVTWLVVALQTGPKCGGGPSTPTGNAAGPVATSPDPSYWTDERMSNAKPAPMPTGPSC